jgi:ABC-type transport system involved in multi-copper enzyme maturation permease subunit
MTALVRSELLKLRSVRMTWGLVAAALVFVALSVVALALASGQRGAPSLSLESTVRSVYASAGSASVVVLVLGIVGMTGEYRHQTITPTFLATPRRGRLLTAKILAHALVGLALAVVCVVLAFLLAAALLTTRTHASISGGTLARVAGGVLLGYAIYAALGVSLGALVRNQVAAIVGALVWVLLVEALLVAFLPAVGRWLPGGALNGVLGAQSLNGGKYLPEWAAALVLLGYGVLFALVAARTTLRRDVT